MPYPQIKDEDFYNKINKKYKKYAIPKKKKSFTDICYPQEYKLQPSQKFLGDFINPKTPYKGVLVFHRIGAGKTCTAVNIGEQWKHQRKIIVVTPASLRGNFRDELRTPCAGNAYLTSKEREKLAQLHPTNKEYCKIMNRSNERIDQFYNIMSYNKFVDLAQSGKLSLRNTLLIIDEIQNMVSAKGVYYDTLYNAIYDAPSSLRLVLLSATPMFDKPLEIALTMNLLRIPVQFPEGAEFEKTFIKCKRKGRCQRLYCSANNMDMFKDMIKGYVSYYAGAPAHAFPEANIKFVKCKMSNFQYRSYLTVLANEEKGDSYLRWRSFKEGQIRKLPNNFFIGTRMISNVAFPDKNTGAKGFKSFKGRSLTKYLKKYSTKFYKIMKKIKSSKGPVLIYSNFKSYGGIMSLIKVLEAWGFSNYKDFGEGKKRFGIWSGDEKQKYKEEIKAVYNNPDNVNGDKMKVIILSPSGKEGVSFKNVNQMHVLEPYWNMKMMDQVIGRAVRYCSHKGLPKEDRFVDVFVYLAVHKTEYESIDEYILKLAQQKSNLVNEFELAMKEAAVDCTLFKYGNKNSGDKGIKCET